MVIRFISFHRITILKKMNLRLSGMMKMRIVYPLKNREIRVIVSRVSAVGYYFS